jgi:hypothetical protein
MSFITSCRLSYELACSSYQLLVKRNASYSIGWNKQWLEEKIFPAQPYSMAEIF